MTSRRTDAPRAGRARRAGALIRFAAAALLAAPAASPAADAPWRDPAWSWRRRVAVQEGFFATATDLKNFPVLVKAGPGQADLFARARPDGADILFTAADGTTVLPHEIEVYRPADEILLAWVRVPLLIPDGETAFHVYYGNASPPKQDRSAEVWSEGFRAVWHMAEAEWTGAPRQARDSSGRRNDASPAAGAATTPEGKIGRGALFAARQSAQCPHDTSLAFTPDTPFTVEAWVRCTVNPDNTYGVAGKGSGGGGWALYYHEARRWQAALVSDYRVESGRIHILHPEANPAGEWRHLALVYDPADRSASLYVDGLRRAQARQQGLGVFDRRQPFVIGGIEAVIDEVRVSAAARSSDWIAASYKNQLFPHQRVVWGRAEQKRP